jgi:DNA invertase Pin-like site-specific DNA recombinase
MLSRQREGIAIAKQKGLYKGGKQKFGDTEKEEIKKLVADGVSIAKISRMKSCSRPTIYKVIK